MTRWQKWRTRQTESKKKKIYIETTQDIVILTFVATITLPSFCGITNEGKSLNLKANFLSNNGYRVRRGQNSLELCNRAYNLLPVNAHKYFGKISG